MIKGLKKNLALETLLIVCLKKLSSPLIFINCFGLKLLDNGHNLDPEPPLIMIGLTNKESPQN